MIPSTEFHRLCIPDFRPAPWQGAIRGGFSAAMIPGTSSHISYQFSGAPISSSSVPVEREMLASIERNKTGLLLYKTLSLSRDELFMQTTVYRLADQKRKAEFDFELIFWAGGLLAHTFIFFIHPEAQGNFYSAKHFLIEQVGKTLFDLPQNRVLAIEGQANGENQYPIRSRRGERDWRLEHCPDGTSKLVRFYERLGFGKASADSHRMFLLSEQTRQEFAASNIPTRQRLAATQGTFTRKQKPQAPRSWMDDVRPWLN